MTPCGTAEPLGGVNLPRRAILPVKKFGVTLPVPRRGTTEPLGGVCVPRRAIGSPKFFGFCIRKVPTTDLSAVRTRGWVALPSIITSPLNFSGEFQ